MQPSEINPLLNLMLPALPSSLVYERMGYQTGVTVNPGTQLFFPSTTGLESFGATEAGVPFGKYYWIAGARFEQSVAVPALAGRAWIALKHVGDARVVGKAAGFFTAAAATFSTDFVDLHGGSVLGTGGQLTGIGGQSTFVVPPGYTVHFATTATPGATTLFNATIVYCVLDIGELHP
jgi:hypothetical protein